MFRRFKPDFTFGTYREITPEFLVGQGIRALLIDIDNTLAPYEQPEPDEALVEWFDALKASGVRAALISNNGAERVELFNKGLELPAYANSHKPSRKTLRVAISRLGVSESECAVLGDQLFTDAYAGRRLGLRVLIVPPIKDKKTLFFRVKRALERPIMRSYERERAKKR